MPCPYCSNMFGTMDVDENSRVLIGVCDQCDKRSLVENWGESPPKDRRGIKRGASSLGTHGAKKSEQKRLKTSGKTHQSEHVVGYKVFAPELKRGQTSDARMLENQAPAYQEELLSHRKHVGTGTSAEGEVYREHQRTMLSNHEIGLAVQYNQLCYASQPEFRLTSPSNKEALETADDSYYQMVDNFPAMPDATRKDEVVYAGVTAREKAEMRLARIAARTGVIPSLDDEVEAMKRYQLVPSKDEPMEVTSGPLASSLGKDRHGIPLDGNCVFTSLLRNFSKVLPTPPAATHRELREQAVSFLRLERANLPLGAINNAYLRQMRLPGTWAGALEVMALAHIWGVRVNIVGPPNEGPSLPNGPTFGGSPSYVVSFNESAHAQVNLYYNDTNHYSIGPIDCGE